MIVLVQSKVAVAEKLRELRARDSRSQEDVAAVVGVSRQAYARYESLDPERVTSPDPDGLCRLADYFRVSVDYLLGLTDRPTPTPTREPLPGAESYPVGPLVLLPVYEEAAAGAPCFVDERPVDRRAVDASRVQHDLPNYILVRVAGESMIARGIMPGSMVLVHRQEDIDDNQVAIVRIKSDGVTIKRVRKLDGGRLMLIPENPAMREEIYEAGEVVICGRVVQAITDIE